MIGLVSVIGCTRSEPSVHVRSDLFAPAAGDEANETSEEWLSATEPRVFEFPRDHGAHPRFKIEWWYYTGNLRTAEGRQFGYQLTFFRTGVNTEPSNPSRWAVRDLYTAHFAVSDLDQEQHFMAQRNNRRGVGWADARTGTLDVWNEDWKAWLDGQSHRLVAQTADFRIDLTLTPRKSPVFHGNQGLSQKGPSQGNASYYYSYTRLETSGVVGIGDQQYQVSGLSWMDHEFSSSFLENGQMGWDWFSLQLDNDHELMLYQMRREDGSMDEYSSGTIVDPQGRVTHLSRRDFTLEPLTTWTSPHTGGDYPLGWRVKVPQLECELDVRAAFADQEMRTKGTTGIEYWEGSISATGRFAGVPVRANGYLELTGYVGRGLGYLFDE
jgi:predicted secreted hydrolase